MKLPVSWLREFVDLPRTITVEKIAAAFVKVGFEVEAIIDPAAAIKGPIKVGKVLSIEELSGHKKPIRYVGLDLGEKKVRFVICGATNFVVGDLVVVALPGAVLPGDFTISARQTYGHLSDGMICSARELGLGDDHSGIIVISEKVKIGTDALVAIGANDPIIDIAVNPDRGYAMSVRGASRELAMALGLPFKDLPRATILSSLERKKKRGKSTPVAIDDKTGADRIFLRSLINVDAKAATPGWMSRRLTQCGMRPISIAVDITNYVMLELGQPLHAFDAAKINGTLKVARANSFKSMTTLDGQKRTLTRDDLVIRDDKKVLALAGTMGGADSEVSDTTDSIALEAAHFDSTAVARNSRRHMLSSEASRRFERGVDPELAELASARAAHLLIEHAGASYVGTQKKFALTPKQTLDFRPQSISELLGTPYSAKEVEEALIAVGCSIRKSAKGWRITSPSWRRDLSHVSDLAEEVARYFGYDRIPSRLPRVAPHGIVGLTPIQARRRQLSNSLAHFGFTEVHNYPFVSQDQMELFAFTGDRAKTFRIANPMSDEFPFLRTHLTPGLLNTAARNLARGEKSVALFESGLIFRNVEKLKSAGDVTTTRKPTPAQIKRIYSSVPTQALHLGGVIAGDFESSGWWGAARKSDWSDAVSMATRLLREIGVEFTVHNVELAPWHPGRCAEFRIDGRAIAHAGEMHPRIITSMNLPERTSAFVLALDSIPIAPVVTATPVNTLPAAIQDISLFVPAATPSGEVAEALAEGAGELLEKIELFDRFQKPGDELVSLAFTLTFRAPDRTLTSDEVSQLRERAGERAVAKVGATIRR